MSHRRRLISLWHLALLCPLVKRVLPTKTLLPTGTYCINRPFFFHNIYFDLSPKEKEGSTYSLALVNQVSRQGLTACQHGQYRDLKVALNGPKLFIVITGLATVVLPVCDSHLHRQSDALMLPKETLPPTLQQLNSWLYYDHDQGIGNIE